LQRHPAEQLAKLRPKPAHNRIVVLHAHSPQRQTNLLQSVGIRFFLSSSLEQRLDPFGISFGSMLSLGKVQCALSQGVPFVDVNSDQFQMLRQFLRLASEADLQDAVRRDGAVETGIYYDNRFAA